MNAWLGYVLVAIVLWGVVGFLQKLGTNRLSSRELMVWLMIGFALLLPWFWLKASITQLGWKTFALGAVAGLANGIGSWELFRSLENGAKASVAIPLTALYPLVTAVLAILLLHERLSPREWIGVFLALAAGGLLSFESPSNYPPGESNSASWLDASPEKTR